MLLHAGRTDCMTEINTGMFVDISFDLLVIAVIISNIFTKGTDWK